MMISGGRTASTSHRISEEWGSLQTGPEQYLGGIDMKAIVLALCIMAATMAPAAEQISTSDHEEIKRELIRGGLPREVAGDLTDAMARARFSREQMHQISEQMDKVRNETAIAMKSKIYEGIAKQAPPEDIMRALDRVRERHGFGYALAADAGPPYQVQLGQCYADCLAAGLQQRHARRIAQALRTRTRHMGDDERNRMSIETVSTAREMVRLGASSQTTTELIDTALENGYDANNMATLRETFRKSSRGNVEALAGRFRNEMEHGIQAGDLDRTRSRDGSGTGGGSTGSGPGSNAGGRGGGGGGSNSSGSSDSGSGRGGNGGGSSGSDNGGGGRR